MVDATPAWIGPTVDVERPNPARMYDFLLGGSHNFAADRAAAQQLIEVMPEAVPLAVLNRTVLRRVVSALVAAGVRQFLDLGSGIPTVGNVHEVAHRTEPSCRVVYVDAEPVAAQHATTLVTDDPRVGAILADLRDVDTVLADPVTRALIDFAEPVAVLMLAVLHFIPDTDDPYSVVAGYRDRTVAGSYLAISHGTQQNQPESALAGMKKGEQIYRRTATPFVSRDHGQIAAFFDGYEMVEPGLVTLPLWRPEQPPDPSSDPGRFPAYAGLGQKPSR
jgi:hypothetical protein